MKKILKLQKRHEIILVNRAFRVPRIFLSLRHLLVKSYFAIILIAYVNQITYQILIISGLFLFAPTSLRAMEEEKSHTINLQNTYSVSFNAYGPEEDITPQSFKRKTYSVLTDQPANKRRKVGSSIDQHPLTPLFWKAPDTYSVSAEEPANKRRKIESPIFYKGDQHSLTSLFWKELDLSPRLKELLQTLLKYGKGKELQKKDIINIIDSNYNLFYSILQIKPEISPIIPGLPHIKYEQLIPSHDESRKVENGRSGAEVSIISYQDFTFRNFGNNTIKIAIKKMKDITRGLVEIASYLLYRKFIPEETKAAKIHDVVICPSPKNCLSIIMEGANTNDIEHFFSTPLAVPAVEASAKFLAKLHLWNCKKVTDKNQEYINHASALFFKLLYNPFKEAKNMSDFFSLAFKRPKNKDKITAKNIMQLLSQKEQECFAKIAKQVNEHFEENSGKIFRSEIPYFLTIPHGDAHGNNLFYYEDNHLITQDGNPVRENSSTRVTGIDWETFFNAVKITIPNEEINSHTAMGYGDPSEDIGRFIGFLRAWAAQKKGEQLNELEGGYSDEKIQILEKLFIDRYLATIKKRNIFTEEEWERFQITFHENSNFHKLRFLQAVWNSEKNPETKKTVALSWIKQNIGLQSISTSPTSDKAEIICNLPAPPEEFIERINNETGTSCLSFLEKSLAEYSSAAVIGQGGVGKTSLVLQYAHKVTGYDLIWFFTSKTEERLLKGYKALLLELQDSIQGQDEQGISLEFEKAMLKISKYKRCLLIYDDVPNSGCLQKWLPKNNENIHILYTSRGKRGWKQPCITFDAFSPEESKDYVSKVTGLKLIPENKNILEQFSEELGHLPLALSHAAHYIKLEAGEKVTENNFIAYLENLKKDPRIHFKKHENPFKNESTKMNYDYLVSESNDLPEIISWVTKEILALASYFNHNIIPERLFLKHTEYKDEIKYAFSELYSSSLIREQESGAFSLHPVVQLVIRNAEESIHKSQRSVSILAKMLIRNFKEMTFLKQEVGSLLKNFPHILKAINHLQNFERSLPRDYHVELLKWIGRVLAILKEKEHLTKGNIIEFDKILSNNSANKKFPVWLKNNAHPEVQLALFYMYDKGYFTNKNPKKALFHFKRAAQEGAIEAQLYFGKLYETQKFRNDEAIKWFAKAARQGHKAALDALHQYADSGYAKAQYKLGFIYANGLGGIETNLDGASAWFKIAASQGYKKAEIYHKIYHKYYSPVYDSTSAEKIDNHCLEQNHQYQPSFLTISTSPARLN